MVDFKKSNEVRDYKEPFEFRLTVGDNIICQRYFKINNFKPVSLSSYELVDAMRNCVKMIDRDLKDKTHVYLEIMAPRFFDSVDEMKKYFKNPNNAESMRLGEGIVVVGSDVDYFWDGNEAKECSFKFDDGEFTTKLTDEDYVEYKFSFCVDGVEASSIAWTGVYPKYIRNSIDLSNKRGRFDGEDTTRLSFEQYLLYKLVEGRNDLVWNLIREICKACSMQDTKKYTTEDGYFGKVYSNVYNRRGGRSDDEQAKERKNARGENNNTENTK